MEKIEILTKVADLESAAENRYAEQVSSLCDGEIKQVLAQIKEDKRQHKEACVKELKKLKKDFDEFKFNQLVDMDLNTLICSTLPEIITFLEVNESKEVRAKKFFEEQIKGVKDKELKKLLEGFLKKTTEHLDKISELLRKEPID